MALDVPVFLKRTGSAIVFAIIMLAGLLWTDIAFWGLVALIQVLCMHEYFKLLHSLYPDVHRPKWIPWMFQAAAFVILVLAYNLYFGGLEFLSYPMTALLVVMILMPALLLLISILPEHSSFLAFLQSSGGLLYITLPMVMLFLMREKSILIPLALILMIWSNDTFAYLVGSFIGKRPLSPISPKKTWEGTVGGALLTIAGALVWAYFTPYYKMQDWLVLALCATIAGTFGDLLESKLKRMANIKDSGSIMPGHGGALDRFDSLLIATPFAFCYSFLFMDSLYVNIF